MRIPTEHFAHVPVVALSPTLLSPSDSEQSSSLSSTPTHSTSSKLNVPFIGRVSMGSAPTSPKLQRNTANSLLPETNNNNNESCSHNGGTSLQWLPMMNISSSANSSPAKK